MDSGDTDIFISEPVISKFSSISALLDPSARAVEDFTRNITIFQSLGCLWPQLVVCCKSKKRSISVIERLLERYAMDLAVVSQKMKTSNLSDALPCFAAARFVRNSRSRIAHNIWNAQDHVIRSCAEDVEIYHEIVPMNPALEIEDDFDLRDADFMYENIEQFLFTMNPILSLQANIKLLIGLEDPVDYGGIRGFLNSLKIFIVNKVSSICEPRLLPGSTRLRYECVSPSKSFLTASQRASSFSKLAVHY